MAVFKILMLLTLMTLGWCQELNGHINPLWLSTSRRDEPRSVQQSGHVNSLWLSAPSRDRSPLLQLYYLDSAGTFRPITLQNPTMPMYRGSDRYDTGRTGRIDRLPTSYGNTNY